MTKKKTFVINRVRGGETDRIQTDRQKFRNIHARTRTHTQRERERERLGRERDERQRSKV